VISLNNELLVELGLGSLPVSDRNLLLQHMYETLEARVGKTIAETLTASDLEEFAIVMEAGIPEASLAFLVRVCPDYQTFVQHEFATLIEEVRAQAPELLATVGQQG